MRSLVILFIFVSLSCYSQHFRNISKSDGIGSNLVHDFIEVDNGIVFFTGSGVIFWNGNKFKEIKYSNGVDVLEVMFAYKEKYRDFIWFCTVNGGLGYIKGEVAYNVKDDDNKNFYSKGLLLGIYGDNNHNVYYVFSPNVVIKLSKDFRISKIITDKSSRLFQGLYLSKKNKICGVSSDNFFEISPDGKINFGLAVKRNLVGFYKIFDSGQFICYSKDSSYVSDLEFGVKKFIKNPPDKISQIFMVGDSVFFCASNKTYIFSTDGNIYSLKDSVEIRDVSRVKLLKDGSIVFSTLSSGFYIANKFISNEIYPFGINNPVYSFSIVRKSLIFGGYYGDLSVLDLSGKLKRILIGNELYSFGLGRIFGCNEYGSEIIVRSDQRGFFLNNDFSRARILAFGLKNYCTFLDKIIFSSSIDIHFGYKKNLEKAIVGRYSGGSAFFSSNPVDITSTSRGFGKRINSVFCSDSFAYVPTSSGLYRYKISYDSLCEFMPFFRGISILCGANLGDGINCVADNFGLIAVFDEYSKRLLFSFSVENAYIFKVVKHTNSSFWICSDKGLYLVSIIDLTGRYQIRNYSRADGLLSDDIHDIVFFNGGWLIATSKGVSVFRKNFYQPRNEPAPRVSFYSFHINGQDTSRFAARSFTGTARVNFSFGCLSLQHLGNLKFRYRLTPDAAWIYTDDFDHELNNLSFGDYRIEIQAKSPYSAWSASLFMPSFQLLPPLLERAWFLILASFLFFSMVLALVYNFQRIRIARIQLEAEMTDASLRSLRSQMKPHFLSNILNSMYYFILNEKPEESGTFVSSFSRLVRHMLESSDKNYLPIPGELSQVQDYVAFECRRADRKVDLNVHFQKDADFSSVLIPSMLLQPILENSLMHGLFPLSDHQGQIDMRIGLVDSPDFRDFPADGIRISRHGRLLVQVLDNGQGREASRKALDKRFTQSFAMRVIEKRLHWIERKFHVRAEMVVTDLKKTDGSAAGTAVTFNLPLMEKVSPEAGIYPVKSERLLSGRA